jgi:hypothetical protein
MTSKLALVAAVALALGTATTAVATTMTCAPALGMVETAQTPTGNDGTAWLRTARGTYTGRLIGTVKAVNAAGLPSRLSYVFRSPAGTVWLTGTPNYARYADMDQDRYVLALQLKVTGGKLDSKPVAGTFTVALSVNTGLNDERGTISSGQVCH